MWAMCLKRVLLCSSPVQTCRSAASHVHPCFSLHPDINVLHYRINASRVANYERFLFKRLFRLPPMSVLTVLLNLHQRKSKCPCHHDGGRKNNPNQTNQVLVGSEESKKSSALEEGSFCSVSCPGWCWPGGSESRERLCISDQSLINWLFHWLQ